MSLAQDMVLAYDVRNRDALERAIARLPSACVLAHIDRDIRNAYEAYDRPAIERALARIATRWPAASQTAAAEK